MNKEIWHLTSVKKKFKVKNPFFFLGKLKLVENSYFINYAGYCQSVYFQRLKKAVLERDTNICKKCGNKANTAHHLVYRDKWTMTRLEDCIAVCNKCHEEIHK